MFKWLSIAIGVLLALIGAIWILQGLNVRWVGHSCRASHSGQLWVPSH